MIQPARSDSDRGGKRKIDFGMQGGEIWGFYMPKYPVRFFSGTTE